MTRSPSKSKLRIKSFWARMVMSPLFVGGHIGPVYSPCGPLLPRVSNAFDLVELNVMTQRVFGL